VGQQIVVEGLSKRYWLQGEAPRTLQQALAQIAGAARARKPFWALRDVSFGVRPGESLALVGSNGAGKSTLLRLLCGLGRPTAGQSRVEGRVAALLDLGTGFHPLLTGRENVYVSGVVSGLRRVEVEQRFDEILEFAEIGPFIDQPLRTYSAGMQVRLAFAVSMHVDPDVLIIDEALAVGDSHFQQKCLDRLAHFRDAGKTLLMVAHDMELVRAFCDRAIWLRRGQIVADGPVEQVTAAYMKTSGGIDAPVEIGGQLVGQG
jgi:lipopolysaccharide transport system ATP-binding protein